MTNMTVARVKALREPGFYRADPTLYLRVTPAGTKQWVQRLTIDGRRHDLGLGGFPLVTLAEARDQAFENRRKVRRGGNPLADRRRSGIPTFREAAARTRDSLRARWRNGKHAKDWMAALERYAFPVFGNLLVDRIRREDVLRVLTPVMVEQTGNRSPGAPADPGRPGVGMGARLRVRERRGRADRRRAPDSASGEGALSGAALWGSLRGAREGGGVRGECGSETLPPIPDPDGRAIRGGARHDLGRDGCGGAGVAHSRRTHERRSGASRPAVGCGARSSRTGARAGRWERPDLPVPAPGRGIHCQTCHLRSCYGTAGWPTARRSTGSGRRSATGAPTRGPRERLLRLHWRTLSAVSKALTSAAIFWSGGAPSWMHGPRS